jgi:hypothetical protein
MTTRRSFLATLLAAGAAPRLGWAAAGNPAYLAAAREPDGSFALFGLTPEGRATFRRLCPRAALPQRLTPAAPRPWPSAVAPAPSPWFSTASPAPRWPA